ncbi:MAG: hypothetical protein ACLRZZ_14560 [Enterocloster sp.]
MANFPIDENQETLDLELRKIETSDPVHADIYNALFQKLINNDAFLERLADKMIRQAMISHVLDSNNAGMVLGADVGPKITTITDELQRALDVLNTNLKSSVVKITGITSDGGDAIIPYPDGFDKMNTILVDAVVLNRYNNNYNSFDVHYYTNNTIVCVTTNDYQFSQPFIVCLFKK